MAAIAIKDIRPVGSELFIDSESFLDDLTADELSYVSGGATPAPGVVAGIVAVAAASNAFCASLVLSGALAAGGIYLATR